MKKIIFLLSLFLFFPITHAASYFNEDYNEDDYHYENHFIVRKVKADRAMGTFDDEDWWKIHYSFDVDVTNFEMRWEALDGTNDRDSRTYVDKRDDRNADDHYNIEHKNFPTYVDNMKITVKYTYNNVIYEDTFFIYSLGKSDQGSVDLAINTTGIAEDYQDTDGSGALGNAPKNPVDTVLSMVKAPYNFMKWAFGTNTQIMFVFSFVLIYVATMMLIKFQSAAAELGAVILLILGIMLFASLVLEGIGAAGF